jgi:predicted ATP-grasp superfamily ATP-dependent carboligase
MGNIVQLDGSGGSIHIDIAPDQWSRCYLVTRNSIELGAETSSYLVSHLLTALDNDTEELIGEISGHKVKWVLSLAEAHCTLYVAKGDSERILFWQDAFAKVIGIIKLSEVEMAQWRKQLEMLL